mmetsp:Transcript_35839/g.83521  ORF Transcript_35839/g.83521 Transcript_35839/m.83521 type:complete len:257 (-) Transcript_35839:1302-2072(-)
MDDRGQRHPLLLHESFETAHDEKGGGRVQSAGGFVQKEYLGAGHEFQTGVDSFFLSPRNPTAADVSDPGVSYADETQTGDDFLGQFVDFFFGRAGGKAETAGVEKVFLHGEFGVDDVVLGDESHGMLEVLYIGGGAVDLDVSVDFAVEGPSAEGVEQRGLSGPRSAHDGRHGSFGETSRDLVHHRFGLRFGLHREGEVFESDIDALVQCSIGDAFFDDIFQKVVEVLAEVLFGDLEFVHIFHLVVFDKFHQDVVNL